MTVHICDKCKKVVDMLVTVHPDFDTYEVCKSCEKEADAIISDHFVEWGKRKKEERIALMKKWLGIVPVKRIPWWKRLFTNENI